MEHPAGNDPAPVASPALDVAPPPSAGHDPSPSPAPVAEHPAPAVVTPADLKVIELQDTDQVRVKVDGKEEVVSAKEYREGISREAVFTRRMQQLAEQRREAEAQLAAQYAQIQTEAQAVEMAKREFANQLNSLRQPDPVQAPPAQRTFDPQDLATVGDVQSVIEAQLAAVRAEQAAREEQFVRALGEASQQVQTQAQLQRDTAAFTNHLTEAMSKPEYQILKQITPYAEEVVRQKVAAMEPKSMAEAFEFTNTYLKGWHADVLAAMTETAKRQEVAKAQAKLEPPTGSAPPPVQQYKPGSSFTKDGKFDWNALRARAEGML